MKALYYKVLSAKKFSHVTHYLEKKIKTGIVVIIMFTGVLFLLVGGMMDEENKREGNNDPCLFLTFSKA